jgi:hypothetical protein
VPAKDQHAELAHTTLCLQVDSLALPPNKGTWHTPFCPVGEHEQDPVSGSITLRFMQSMSAMACYQVRRLQRWQAAESKGCKS